MIRDRSPDGLRLQVIVYAGIDGATGKERYLRRTVRGTTKAATRKAAEEIERRLALQVADGQAQSTSATLGATIDAWLELAGPQLSPTTEREYRRKVDKHIRPELGNIRLSKLTTARLDRFYADKLAAGAAPASVRQMHAIIRRALSRAVRWGWTATNVAAVEGTAPSVPKRKRAAVTADDAARIIVATRSPAPGRRLTDPVFATYVWLAFVTGARRGELCALRWSHIDWTQQHARIEDSVLELDDELVTKSTKTDEPRTEALGPVTITLLREYRQVLLERALAGGVSFARDAYVCPGSIDGNVPLRPATMTQRFGRLVRRLKIPIRLHDLRHANASLLLDAGTPMSVVSGRLGHRDESTTANIYSHPMTAAERRAAEVIEELVAEQIAQLTAEQLVAGL